MIKDVGKDGLTHYSSLSDKIVQSMVSYTILIMYIKPCIKEVYVIYYAIG